MQQERKFYNQIAEQIFIKPIVTLSIIATFILPFEQVCGAGIIHLPAKTATHKTKSLFIHEENQARHVSEGYLGKRLQHTFKVSPLNRLPVLASGEVALPTNADNFHGSMNASVNPRTGSASFGFTVASTLYDLGQNRRDLSVSYAGSPVPAGSDFFGLGPQWGWNIGLEKPSTTEIRGHKTTDISTGDGHSFTMESERDATGKTVWHPLRHKLKDVIITGTKGNWTISMGTGTRVHIAKGYEDWEESQDGHRIWFYYNHASHLDMNRRLVYLCSHPIAKEAINKPINACANAGVWITYQGNVITVHGKQDIALVKVKNINIDTISKIVFPTLSSPGVSGGHKKESISFAYDHDGNRPWLLHSVSYPTGLSTIFLYNDESKKSTNIHGLPTGINGAFLPVVTEQITRSTRENIPEKHLWFHYGKAHGEEHNYTGYQGSAITVPGLDNLLDRPDNYTYSVTVDNGMTSTTTTYNKYHLPLTVTQKDDNQNTVIAHSDETYVPWKNTTFDELPPNYSLATMTSKVVGDQMETGHDKASPCHIIETRQYNDNGQPVWRRDAYGRETFIQYCPASGDAHCPSQENGMPDVTLPEKIVQLPAKPHTGKGSPFMRLSVKNDGIKARETTFYYVKIPLKGQSASGAGVLQVSQKITGLLPLNETQGLKPGMKMPDMAPSMENNKTLYQYDTAMNSPVYGQLKRLAVIKNPIAPSRVRNMPFLNLATANNKQESITFNIEKTVDVKKNEMRTTVSIDPSSNIQDGTFRRLAVSPGFSLGTSTWSLSTGDKLASTDAGETVQSQWIRDSWGRPIKQVTTPRQGGEPHIITWKYILNDSESAVIKTLPDGEQQKMVTGPDGELLSVWHRNKSRIKGASDETSDWIPDTSISYTRTGNPASKVTWFAADSESGVPGKLVRLVTTYGYDNLNRPVWTKDPDGLVAVNVHDDAHMRVISYQVVTGHSETAGPVIHVTESNLLGKPSSGYVFSMDPDTKKEGHYEYPARLRTMLRAIKGKLKSVSSLQTLNATGFLPIKGADGLFNFIQNAIKEGAWLTHEHTTYDGFGRMLTHTSANGATTRMRWNDGNLVAVIAPDGHMIHDSFNLQGKKVSRCVVPKGGKSCHLLGTRKYDSKGQLISTSDEYGNVIKYAYDIDGRKVGMTTPGTRAYPEGHQYTWKYNSIGPIEALIDGTVYARYTYNPQTWALTDSEDRVSHLHYTYDSNGKLVSITRSAPRRLKAYEGIHYPEGTRTIQYEPKYGQPVSYTDNYGNVFRTLHDNLGRIVRTEVHLAGQNKNTLLTATAYDDFNRPERITNGVGITRTFLYNSLGQVAYTTESKNGCPFLTLGYLYDNDTGNITGITRKEGDLSSITRYQYDIGNNLVSVSCGTTGNESKASPLCPRETALAGSGLSHSPLIRSQHYTFDSWNNISEVTEQLTDNKDHSLSKTVRYSYAGEKTGTSFSGAYDPNRMLAFDVEWSGQSFSEKPHTIKWDKLGRIIKDAEGNTLHYNAFGRQDRFVNGQTGEITRYTYDSLGNQVAEQPFSPENKALQAPLYMLYSGNHVESQVQHDDRGHTHVSVELGSVAHSEDGSITRWYFHDYKGDVISTYNSAGMKIESNFYSPYGMRYDALDDAVQHFPAALQLAGQRPWWQEHRPGFNGEMSDLASGYQFLGGGYRAYNPVYRHFMAKDSFSPFTKIDGFGFGDNNPVMNTDPSGHMPSWVGYAMGAFSIAMSIGLGILLPVASASTVSLTGVMVASIVGGVTSGVLGTVSGSLQISSTAHPHNKPLAIASQSFSIASGVADMIVGGLAALGGIKLLGIVGNVAKAEASLVIASGVSGFAASGLGALGSGLSVGAMTNQGLAFSTGFSTALTVINGISMALMAGSILTGMGLGVWAGMNRLRSRRVRSAVFLEEISEEPEQLSVGGEENNSAICANIINELKKQESLTNNTVSSAGSEVSSVAGSEASVQSEPGPFDDVNVSDNYSYTTQQGENTNITLDITSAEGTMMLVNPRTNKVVLKVKGKTITVFDLKKLIMTKSALFQSVKDAPNLQIRWKTPTHIEVGFENMIEHTRRVFGSDYVKGVMVRTFNRTRNPTL